MSPPERMQRLVDEVRAELVRIERVVDDLHDATTALAPDCGAPSRLAVAACVHSFYTGCEAVLVRLVRAGGTSPEGRDWHQALLILATAPVAGVRPPIIAPATARSLLELLRFRHFFRASYGVELDVSRLRELADLVPVAHVSFRADIDPLLHEIETSATGDEPKS